MAAYMQETPRTRRRRRGRDRRATAGGGRRNSKKTKTRRRRSGDHEGESGAAAEKRGKTRTDHEEATLTATHSRGTKDGKVEEHPLEPVRPLGASGRAPSRARPGEARRRAFVTAVLARPSSLRVLRTGPKYTTAR